MNIYFTMLIIFELVGGLMLMSAILKDNKKHNNKNNCSYLNNNDIKWIDDYNNALKELENL